MTPLGAIVCVGLGGALGSNARYWLGKLIAQGLPAASFPWATLAINVSGSLLLAIIALFVKERSSAAYLLLGTGFCGGYTTFSTFSLEVIEAIQRGRWDWAILYVLVSVIAGLAAVALIVKMGGLGETT